MRIVTNSCLLVVFTVCLAFEARGQENHLPLIGAPPPMKFVPRSERTQLSTARDPKARLRASIELANARLLRAEELTAGQRYEAASNELGVYHGLMEDVLFFLGELKDNKKMRDTYKRLELGVRAHSSRLESIRRSTPAEYSVNLKVICECAHKVRTQALNAFYGDTVVHENEKTPDEGAAPADQPAASSKIQ
jgi:hypothetical protein